MFRQGQAPNAAWHGMFCIENLVEGKEGQEARGVIRKYAKKEATDLGDVAAASSDAMGEARPIRCVCNLYRARLSNKKYIHTLRTPHRLYEVPMEKCPNSSGNRC